MMKTMYLLISSQIMIWRLLSKKAKSLIETKVPLEVGSFMTPNKAKIIRKITMSMSQDIESSNITNY